MTVPTYPPPYLGASPPHGRPTTVTISSVLLFVIAAAQVGYAFLTFSALNGAGDVYADEYSGTEFEDFGAGLTSLSVMTIVIYLIVAVGLTLLGIFNLRGKQPSRVITWVVAGLLTCCAVVVPYTSIVLVTQFATVAGENSTGTGQLPSQRELDARLADVVPGWFESAGVIFTLFTLGALIAVIILLAVPPSNRFFKKPVAGWGPYQFGQPYAAGYGQPGGGQPGFGQPGQPVPGLPPYPGQQAGGGPSPYPGQPGGAAPYPGQSSYPGQPGGAAPYPGQSSYPGQPAAYPGYPGQQPGYPGAGGYPEQPGYPGGYPPAGGPYSGTPGQPAASVPESAQAPAEFGPASDPWQVPHTPSTGHAPEPAAWAGWPESAPPAGSAPESAPPAGSVPPAGSEQEAPPAQSAEERRPPQDPA
ncbi:hypothetical protein ACTOB_000095 [Actinoplanes oblitus]|uniref:Uncharacterized protein n=1 Tax=Actinoplanes oblitus TaxID=3040509 RepID=A0ABY8WHW1_9ACTN|nr:hypothetical protein [Actinoplanes oblitus]WIM96646.1 hypothetical protein ACTOB_000095 [Actinoplanes oblitus]